MKKDRVHRKLGPLAYTRSGYIVLIEWRGKSIYRRIRNLALLNLGRLEVSRMDDSTTVSWNKRMLFYYLPGHGLGFGKITQ